MITKTYVKQREKERNDSMKCVISWKKKTLNNLSSCEHCLNIHENYFKFFFSPAIDLLKKNIF